MYCKITERIFGIFRLLKDEEKNSRDYGGGVMLSHAEVVLLETIARCQNQNVSDLSENLKITKGAITQMVGKLCQKDLIETVKRDDNKKEKYFRLTARGTATINGHQDYHEQANKRLCDFVASLNKEETDTIFRFLDCLEQCMPFCEFKCVCGKSNKNNLEEIHDETIIASRERPSCRS